MYQIELSAPLNLPGTDVLAAASEIMDAVEDQKPPYDTLALSVDLRDLKVPFDAQLRVPIRASVEKHVKRWQCHIEIGAAKSAGMFPHFSGELTITPEGAGHSRLWLQGKYNAPLGILGMAVDGTVFRGAAERSLNNFLTWLAAEIEARVVKAERERLNRVRGIHQ